MYSYSCSCVEDFRDVSLITFANILYDVLKVTEILTALPPPINHYLMFSVKR